MVRPVVLWCSVVACLSLAASSVAEPPPGTVSLRELRSPSSALCLDSYGRAGPVMLNRCHGKRGNQEWTYDLTTGALRNPSSGLCLDAHAKDDQALVGECLGSRDEQRWTRDRTRGELRNAATGQCLDGAGRAGPVRMTACSGSQGSPGWELDPDGAVDPACGGTAIDLAAAARNPACVVAGVRAARATPDAASKLALTLSAPAGKVLPGATAVLTAVLTNAGDAPVRIVLPLGATSPDVTVELKAIDGAGVATDEPMNRAPCPPKSVAAQLDDLQLGVVGALSADQRGVRVELPPGGSARLALTWHADGVKWGPARTADGKCESARLPAPLKGGKYTVSARIVAIDAAPLEAHVDVVVGR